MFSKGSLSLIVRKIVGKILFERMPIKRLIFCCLMGIGHWDMEEIMISFVQA